LNFRITLWWFTVSTGNKGVGDWGKLWKSMDNEFWFEKSVDIAVYPLKINSYGLKR